MPVADVELSLDLVHALLRAQHPDLADLPLAPLAAGWDNELVRLGDGLIVRLPRRAVAAGLIEHELAWLPVIAKHCSLPVPVPVRRGVPGAGYPHPWSIVPYLRGQPVDESMLDTAAARALGGFVRGLHVPAPGGAPYNPVRGVALVERTRRFEEALAALGDRPDLVARAREVWQACVATPAWDLAPVWLHGDLHPGNVLWDGRTVCAVIDFGDLTAGDPATDLAIAYMCFDDGDRAVFLHESGADAATCERARGWAVAISVAVIASDDAQAARIGERALAAALR